MLRLSEPKGNPGRRLGGAHLAGTWPAPPTAPPTAPPFEPAQNAPNGSATSPQYGKIARLVSMIEASSGSSGW